jgi:hypothetical protein
MTLRKVTKNRSLFPNDEAVFKLMYLALRNISKRWTMPIKNWSGALNQFAILFEGRVPLSGLTANSLTQTNILPMDSSTVSAGLPNARTICEGWFCH